MAADADASAAFSLYMAGKMCYDEQRNWKGGETMERYLTKKCRPGKGVVALENLALVACFALFALCIGATVYVLVTYVPMVGLGGLSWQNFLLLIPAALLAAAMNPLGERLRARKHARVIVEKLQQAGGRIPADEAEAIIGVRRAAETAQQLVEKGYLTDVRLVQGCRCLGEAAPEEAPAEEIKPLFHDAEV